MLRLATSGRITAAQWLSSPVSALLVILLLLAGLAHMLAGLRSVFLDYVHTRARLVLANLLLRAVTAILAGASVLAVLKLFLGH
jgi:succinate dehydrogenase / fumarate reductase membrane anchor subunit